MKRLFAIIMVFAIIFSSISVTMAAPVGGSDLSHPERQLVTSIAADDRNQSIKDTDEVRIIVELDDNALINQVSKKSKPSADLQKAILDRHKSVKNDIENNKISIDYHYDFEYVFNGFSGTTTFANAKKIEKVPGVKRVVLANKYSRPELKYSKDAIFAKQTWDLGYKGDGMVVAILDTGLDSTHKDFVLAQSDNPRFSKEDMNSIIETKNLPGKWYTDKVPYGYNYADNNAEIRDLGPEASMHGMHVGGTVGANGDENNGGLAGVAPKCQLLGMKVFGNDPGEPSCYGDTLVKAINDAVKLGADVINMSLGSTADYVRYNDPEQDALRNAAKSGVFLALSAGNSNCVGDGYYNPYAKNPDIGVVGAPGLVDETLQVAAAEKGKTDASAMDTKVGSMAYIASGDLMPEVVLKDKTYYVDCGTGASKSDFEGKDLKGKIALIKRGGCTFEEKILGAQNSEAIGVIVYNHEAGANGIQGMSFSAEKVHIPAVFIGNGDGKKLISLIAGGDNYVEFTGKQMTIPNPNAGKMATFTSWGTTSSLDFKPEITAPGVNIDSTLNDDQYGGMSGTSMASPHVAGGAALVLQKIKGASPTLTGGDKVKTAKNIIMSTAHPLVDKGSNNAGFGLDNYYSPRRQGAGMMDLKAAVTTPAYIVNPETGVSKANLKEIGDNVEFTLEVKNISNKTLTYNVNGTVETDMVDEDGFNALEAQGVYKKGTVSNDTGMGEMPISFDNNTITVAPNNSTKFTVKLNLKDTVGCLFVEENKQIVVKEVSLNELFPNGTFIEGFVRLVPTDDATPEIGVPYMGFYGDWNKAPILDDSLYDANGENSFYGLTSMGWYNAASDKYEVLGAEPDKNVAEKIGFSPNGDGVADTIVPVLSFLRNARELDINILDKDKNKLRDLTKDEFILKNCHDGGDMPDFYAKDSWTWDGKINNIITEGEYVYEIKARIDYAGSEWQTFTFPVRVDITAPVIESALYDKTQQKLTVTAKDNSNKILKYELIDGNGKVLYTSVDEKPVFDLSKLDKNISKLLLKVYDCGLNTVSQEVKINEISDGTVPSVYIDSISSYGRYGNSQVEISGYITDNSGLEALMVDGKSVPFTHELGTNKYDFNTSVEYADGMHKVSVTAKDKAGNSIDFIRNIFIDTKAPTIEMTQAPTQAIVDSTVKSIKLSGVVNDNMAQMRVMVSGNEIFYNPIPTTAEYQEKLAQPGKYEIKDYELPLIDGKNIITVEAEDVVGHKTVKEYIVYRKTQNLKEMPAGNNVDANKKWTVELGEKVKPSTIDANISVIDSLGVAQNVNLTTSADNKKVFIDAPTGGYTNGNTYYILIVEKLKSFIGHMLKQPVMKVFTIKN